jgi:hypothetical protein
LPDVKVVVGANVVSVEDDNLLGLVDGLDDGVSLLGVEVVFDTDGLADGVSCNVDGLLDGLMDRTFVISGEDDIFTVG